MLLQCVSRPNTLICTIRGSRARPAGCQWVDSPKTRPTVTGNEAGKTSCPLTEIHGVNSVSFGFIRGQCHLESIRGIAGNNNTEVTVRRSQNITDFAEKVSKFCFDPPSWRPNVAGSTRRLNILAQNAVDGCYFSISNSVDRPAFPQSP